MVTGPAPEQPECRDYAPSVCAQCCCSCHSCTFWNLKKTAALPGWRGRQVCVPPFLLPCNPQHLTSTIYCTLQHTHGTSRPSQRPYCRLLAAPTPDVVQVSMQGHKPSVHSHSNRNQRFILRKKLVLENNLEHAPASTDKRCHNSGKPKQSTTALGRHEGERKAPLR